MPYLYVFNFLLKNFSQKPWEIMKNMRSGVWKPTVSGRFTGLYQQLELNGRR